MTTLVLNNQSISGKDLTVTLKMVYKSSDASGQGSSTDTLEQGIKAKSLFIKYKIPYDKKDWLKEITKIAESVDDKGKLTIYRIINDTANTMGLYKVFFSGELSVVDTNEVQYWTVTFTLKEKLSVPERKQQRENLPAAAQQGLGSSTGAAVEDDNIPPNVEYTTFESVLKVADDAFAAVSDYYNDDENIENSGNSSAEDKAEV